MLRKRSYVSGVVFVLVFFASIVGFSLTMGLFLQIGLGYTPIRASLLLAAMATGAFICSGVGAWGATAVGRPILHIGLTIMAAGTVVLWLSLRPAHQTVGTLSLIPRISPEPREHPAWGRRTPRLTGLRPHASAPSPKLITERDRLPDGKTRGQPPFCTQSLACWGVVCTALNRHYVASGSAAWQRGQAW